MGGVYLVAAEERGGHCSESPKALPTPTHLGKDGHQGSLSCFCHLAAPLFRPWDLCADMPCAVSGRGQGPGGGVALCILCGDGGVWGSLSPVSVSEKARLKRAQFC